MNVPIRRLWRRKPLLIAGFTIALALTVLFGVKTALKYNRFKEHRDKPVAAWMTPGFVARSKQVDIEVVREALGLPLEERDRRTLYRIALDKGVPPSELIAELQNAIDAAREAEPGK